MKKGVFLRCQIIYGNSGLNPKGKLLKLVIVSCLVFSTLAFQLSGSVWWEWAC